MGVENCLIIAGMHRSGTSLVAQTFFKAGLFLGDRLSGPSRFNPEGYFEDRDIVQFHDRVLAAHDAAWHSPSILGKKLAVGSCHKGEIINVIQRKFHGYRVWGWKDPRAALFLSFWQEALPGAKFVLVFRNPEEVVWSLIRRGDFKTYAKNPLGQAILALRIWTHYNKQILEFARRHPKLSLLLHVPVDLLKRDIQAIVTDVITHSWGFNLRDLAEHMARVYRPFLMRQTVPTWISLLTRAYPPAVTTLCRLNQMRDRLLFQHTDRVVSCLLYRQGSQKAEDCPVVCIISPNKNAYSETFIRAHIDRLPAKVRVLYGGWFPVFIEDGKTLLPLFQRGVYLALSKGLGINPKRFQNAALRRYLRRERVKVVLAEYGPTGVSVMEACRAEGVPLIVHFHGFDAYDHQTLRTYKKEYSSLFRMASGIIAVSRDMERQLLKLGAPRKELYYNPCGVDTTLFSGANPSTAPPLFLAVGRFVDKKAPHLTILSFKKVAEACPNARLIMIGDGELWEACKKLAYALRIADKVNFLGVKSHIEVALTMKKARAFVQHSVTPTYGDSEGTPVAVLEAGASGLPVVSTRHGGIKDVVIDGETGFLVQEGDIEGMAERMLRLAKDPSLSGQLGKRARSRICREFSIEKRINNLWCIIGAVIEGVQRG